MIKLLLGKHDPTVSTFQLHHMQSKR